MFFVEVPEIKYKDGAKGKIDPAHASGTTTEVGEAGTELIEEKIRKYLFSGIESQLLGGANTEDRKTWTRDAWNNFKNNTLEASEKYGNSFVERIEAEFQRVESLYGEAYIKD